MGKIEKIIKKGSVEGQTTEVYPVTSTKAVYDENNKRLDNIITGLQESVYLKTPIPISTDNTTESKAQNVKNISDYIEKAKAAGIADVNGMGVTCLIDDYFSGVGYIMGNTDVSIHGIKTTDDLVDNRVFSIQNGEYYESKIQSETSNELNTTSKKLVPAINEVNTLAKSKGNGTITEVRMNGVSKGTSGVVDLGTVITAHQDISGKQDKLISGTNIKTINGESVLGSGDITITSSGGAYPEVNHGTGDTTFTLTPNTFHVWDEVTSLTLNFGNETSGVANEYLFQFTSGSTATSLTLPDDIKWANDNVPTIGANMIYQMSILHGLASVLEFNYIDYNKEPLTFKISSPGTINWTASDSSVSKTIEYKLNNGDKWVSIASNTGESAPTITVKAGDKIQFRGDNTAYCADNSDLCSAFSGSTAEFEVEGNIMSLINSTDFSALTTLESNFTFALLFMDCAGLTSAENLILPAMTLAIGCYAGMFGNCTSLTMAPKLPATSLADGCYINMFNGCTSLTTAPKLPANTLAMGCYGGMFGNCTSLTTVPELPATTLVEGCYSQMFSDCTSLTTVPELPATNLKMGCYSQMFNGCTSLNYIKCLATDISASNCTMDWVNGVAATGTFVQNPDMDEWETGVNGIPVNWTVEGHGDFSTKPLTFNILSAGTINWTASDTTVTKTIDYKLNDGEWTSIISNTGSSAPTINVIKGDKVQFRGSNTQYATDYYSTYNSFSGSTALFEAEGNIMSLIYGDDFKNKLTISSTSAFASLFRNCTNLVSAKNLVLPATTLANYCYYGMFWNCTSLTTAPSVLPATTLADGCYADMFQYCTSLTTAPALPATTLAIACYGEMFWNCKSLTTAPKLPATTLTSTCYQNMFRGCSSLTVAPELPATTLADSCYLQMFYDCTSLTTAPSALPATTLASNCYSSMFNGCTSLTTAPTLPATTLASYCYSNMFEDCTSLITAPELPATTLATSCYSMMFKGCTKLITAPALPATTLADYCYDSMFLGCTSLTTAPALPATTLGHSCYSAMFSDCRSLTTAPALPATTLALFCYNSMFAVCTSLTTAPELPATTLERSCYDSMFYKCTKLNYIKCLATNISATNCTSNWVSGVASTGTFVKAAGMSGWTTGNSGIPSGWTVRDA